jgi:hypothetical protein
MSRSDVALLAAFVVGVVGLAAGDARACAACGCGSQAPLPLGSELPFAGRFRTAVLLTSVPTTRTDRLGSASLLAGQGALALAFSFDEHWVVDGTVPLGARVLTHDDTVEASGVGVGDVDVGVRYVLRGGGLSAGVRLAGQAPTTSVIRDRSGDAINGAVQPGPAAWGVSAQGHVAYERGPLLGVLTVAGAAPLSTSLPWQSGPGLQARAVAYLRATPVVSAVVGASALLAGDTTSAGRRLADARVSVGPEAGIVLEIALDWTVSVSAWVPASTTMLAPAPKTSVTDGARVILAVAKDW